MNGIGDLYICCDCRKEKPNSEYYPVKARKATHRQFMSYCKSCTKDRAKAKYNPEYRREYESRPNVRIVRREHERKHYRRQHRNAILAYGGKCECCGETEPSFLELDHINGGGCKERRGMNDYESYYRRIAKEKPDYLRVLCSNCNRGRWRNGGICPHQVVASALTGVGVDPSKK